MADDDAVIGAPRGEDREMIDNGDALEEETEDELVGHHATDGDDEAPQEILDEDDAHSNGNEEKDGLRRMVDGDDGTPRVGMVFKSYDEVVTFYKQYALRVGFGVAVRKSSFTKSGLCRRLILACTKGGKGRPSACYQARVSAKTNCPAMIIVKLWGDGLLHLGEAQLEHNHTVNPSTARLMRCYKMMPNVLTEDLAVQEDGHENSRSAEKECKNYTEGGLWKFGEGDVDVILQFFASMQAKSPHFFYLVDLNREGRLKNLFWADARCRVACRFFGDVISFDTTYLTEKYDLPLLLFVGVNHHGQLVLLGCALLSDEATETYIWLFNAFVTCMSGCQPNAIITDHNTAIQDAIAEVFPGVRHRLCLSNIMKKIPEKLRGLAEFKAIKKALKRVAFDSLSSDEFEEEWKKMLEDYKLQDNDWLNVLYENRCLWVPVFLKDTFWAGMSIFQRDESVSTFFDGSIYPRTSLKQFVSKYETALESKYKKEIQADIESLHKSPLSVSKFYMEEQLSKLYTLNIFRKFQDELKATMYCHVTLAKVDGPIYTFGVKECSYMEDGKQTESKDHEVLYNSNELDVQCICGSFEFRGILCRHTLSVFKLQQVFEIPAQYILDRWKKNFKRLHALSHSSNDMLANNLVERYDHLSTRCLQLVELGVVSDDKYQLALKLISEVENLLLDDSTCKHRQPKFLSFETQSNENVQNFTSSLLAVAEGNKQSTSLPGKRRGRPPKRVRETNMETMVRSNKEKDFLSSSLMGDANNVFQVAPTASHLDAHNGMQGGINLMEDVNPNDLSFGSHFGLHVNHRHIDHQSRIQLSNSLQGRYDQQVIGDHSGMQWIYQQMLQDDQIPKSPSGRRIG